jgi:hypothetical protein
VLDRREFLSSAVAAALAASPIARAAAPKRGFTELAYSKAFVIDALGGPGGFDPDRAPGSGLAASELADVKASGVNVVNLTVNSVGNGPNKFEETVAGIAESEKMIVDHPDHANRHGRDRRRSRPRACTRRVREGRIPRAAARPLFQENIERGNEHESQSSRVDRCAGRAGCRALGVRT